MLTDQEPPVSSLGVDHQAARRRRIPVLRQRFLKAKRRKIKLRALKIPALKICLRLHKGGVQPVALWGGEAQRLAPQNRTALRQAMATHLGHHSGGLLDSIYDLHSNKYQDPADQVLIQHAHLVPPRANRAAATPRTSLATTTRTAPAQAASIVHSTWTACGDHCLPHGVELAG